MAARATAGKRLTTWTTLLLAVSVACGVTAQEARHPVRTAPVEERPVVRTVSTYGVLAPKVEDLSFRIAGRIARFHAVEGQPVEAGAVLAELDTRDARDALETARVSMEQAQRQLERFEKLAGDRMIRAEQLDDARDTLETARISFEQAELKLARCTLRAPARGVILREYVDSRTTVAAGTPIYSFRDVSKSWITEVQLTDRNAFVFGIGTRARAWFAPYPGQVFGGVLTKQAGVADDADSLYTVEISIDPGERELRPGMVVEIDLIHESEVAYSVVPLDALVDVRRSRAVVYLLDEAGARVEERRVHIQAITGSHVALVERLPSGRAVVIRGQQSLADQSAVRVL